MLKFAPLGPMGKEEPYVVGREILSVSRGVHRKSVLGIPQIKGQATAFVAGFVPRFCFAGDSVKQMSLPARVSHLSRPLPQLEARVGCPFSGSSSRLSGST